MTRSSIAPLKKFNRSGGNARFMLKSSEYERKEIAQNHMKDLYLHKLKKEKRIAFALQQSLTLDLIICTPHFILSD